MYLEDLIKKLEDFPNKEYVCKIGFSSPHSYRGYYEELAVEPTPNVTVQSMLDCLKEALGNTYTGYKGGEFTMTKDSIVNLSKWGTSYDSCRITTVLLNYMLGEYEK